MITDVTFGSSRRQVIAVGVLTIAACLAIAPAANCTVVRLNTVSGTIDVRLYDTATPATVANFLNYLNSSRYNGTFIHRDVPGFVIQGGGYSYNAGTNSAPHIATFSPVVNEFGISNTRGTIAMAKLGGNPNSATSEWFFNLSDSNASNLDNQNGGFTVFGRVVGSGMTVVDAIAALPRYDLDGSSGSTFDTVPLRSATAPLTDALVFVNTMQVLNFKSGDYDFNGTVDMADYTVWRNTLGSTTNAAADGNGNGVVDANDYLIWRKTLGQSGGPGSGSGSGLVSFGVPEPASGLLLFLSVAMSSFCRPRFWPGRLRQAS